MHDNVCSCEFVLRSNRRLPTERCTCVLSPNKDVWCGSVAQLAQAAAVAALGWRLAPSLPLAMTAQTMAFVALNRVRHPQGPGHLRRSGTSPMKDCRRHLTNTARRTTTGREVAAGLVRC